jgi:hypothetical protein
MTDDNPQQANLHSIRSSLAQQHGLSTDEVTYLLTGTDAETLQLQAERLAAMGQPVHMNVAPREGQHVTNTGPGNESFSTYVNELFNGPTDILDILPHGDN